MANSFWQRWLLGQIEVDKRDPESVTRHQRFAKVLEDRALRCVFQPIVDLKTHRTFAFESLCRCSDEMFKNPLTLFETAVETDRVGELGRLLREMTVDACTTFPLFVNIHPSEFDSALLVQPTDPIYWHSEFLFLEITESAPLHYFQQCHSVLNEARSKGVRLAIDDFGAGYSNVKYISDLEPDIVKLDRDLVMGVEPRTRAFKLLENLVRLCKDMGAKVVVEGIETETELACAVDAGADFGQGFLLARPAYPLG